MDQHNNIINLFHEKLPIGILKIFDLAGTLAEGKQEEIYLVGGVVRDLLIDYPVEKDFDMVVVGNAICLAGLIQSRLGGKLTTYKKYNTATLQLDEEISLDLATARKEYYPLPAALPQVEPSNLKEDLYRRDFTFNAIACSLMPGSTGLLFDYYRGISDIKQKLIRIMHPTSFYDDPLRIIRAIRFEQRYGFCLEEATSVLISKALEENLLSLVSGERLERELANVNKEQKSLKIMQRLYSLGLTRMPSGKVGRFSGKGKPFGI
jgi:tRNA nucleotidyltransferase (CCA-adding enzyme)